MRGTKAGQRSETVIWDSLTMASLQNKIATPPPRTICGGEPTVSIEEVLSWGTVSGKVPAMKKRNNKISLELYGREHDGWLIKQKLTPNDDGKYHIVALDPGEYQIRLIKKGRIKKIAMFAIMAGQHIKVDL